MNRFWTQLFGSRFRLEAQSEFIFPGARTGRPLSNTALLAVLKRMGYEITSHGFRSTFKDWCVEHTNFPREVSEMALAHIVSDKVEAAYRRGDLLLKRQLLMMEWAKFCQQQPVEREVVQIKTHLG